MGPFALIHKKKMPPHDSVRATVRIIFERLGFDAPLFIEDKNYIVAVSPKRQTGEIAFEQFPNGDFVMALGTFFYAGTVGKEAAVAFYDDYIDSPEIRKNAMGHFAVVLRKRGVTEIILDSFGGFHLYCDANMDMVSSSLLAVAFLRNRVAISVQGVYEYVFDGVVSGNATLFDEVILAPVNSTIKVSAGGLEFVRHALRVPTEVCGTLSRNESIERSMELLDRYFAVLARNFGNRVTSALSGGYDSRLILAFLRRHGVLPRLYVYGPNADAEICLVREVAKSEELALETLDKDEQPLFEPDEFAEIAQQNLLATDGYSWEGIFNNGTEYRQRAYRVDGDSIALNGGGGEAWRNFFYLPDREYRPREILWSFYSQFDPQICTGLFNEEDHFRCMEGKIASLIGGRLPSLPRPAVEWLYHNFRCRAWDCRVNSINTTFGNAALPFLERPLTDHASTVPLRWKNHGAYEAELIRRADARLASYRSVYGHDFSGPPRLNRRLTDYGTYLRPTWLRRFSFRVKHRVSGRTEWPKYLHKRYVDAVLPRGVQVMSAFFRLHRVANPAQMTRILTVEYLVTRLDGVSVSRLQQ